MPKRLILMFSLALCALMMGISTVASPAVQAVDSQGDVFSLAQYLPAEATVYGSLRTDDAYIAELDGYLGKFEGAYAEVLALFKSPFGVEMPWTIVNLTKGSIVGANKTFPDLLNIIGDQYAMASTSDGRNTYIVVPVNDSEGFAEILTGAGNTEVEAQGDFHVFTPSNQWGYTWYVSETLAFATFNGDEVLIPNFPTGEYAKLSDNPTFQVALTSLPDYEHDFFLYVDGEAITTNPAMLPTFSTLGMNPQSLTISGGALADGTLALDVVVRPAAAPNSPITQPIISAEFVRNAPLSADMVIHGSNLSKVLTDLRERVPNYATFVEQVKTSTQFDIQAFQAALGSEFILFQSYDAPLLGDVMATNDAATLMNSVQAGMALQMVDSAAATEQAMAVGNLFNMFIPMNPNTTITTEKIGDVIAMVLNMPTPVGTNQIWDFQLIVAAKDDVLFIGTGDAIREILNGQVGYTDIAGYGIATANILPNASSIGYMGSDGLFFMAAFPAITLIGSQQVGSVSSTMSMELGTVQAITPESTVELSLTQAAALTLTPEVTQEPTSTPIPSPTPVPTATPDFHVVVPQVIERIARLLPGASFSTSYDTDGIHRLRFTLSLGE
jgi:hypothetical protein